MSSNIVLYLEKGERRRIQLDVYSCKNEPFTILDAAYEIIDANCQTVISGGDCSIKDKTLSFMYDAIEKGQFTVIFTLAIADEIIKEKMVIRVT